MTEIKEREYRQLKSNIGMFDVIKGIGMLVVLIGHTISSYTSEVMQSSNILVVLLGIAYATIAENIVPGFLVISGYGFRKRPIKKCVKQQVDLMLKPYGYVMLITICAFLCIHYACFRYLPASLMETVKILGGFLFALPVPMILFRMEFFSCGVVWYFVAMFLGWIFLDFLMTVFSEKYWDIAVICVVLLGWLISVLLGNLPFCLIQGLLATGYLYIGYRSKKQKAFFIKFSNSIQAGMIVFIVLQAVIIATGRSMDNMTQAKWTFGPFSILFSTVFSYIFIYLGLYLNQMDHIWINILRKIGRNSLYIFCIHTIELAAIPWYLVFPDADPFIRCIVILTLRMIIIFGGCFVLNYRKRKRRHSGNRYLVKGGKRRKR